MNDENQAWRMIGLAARLCIELGLHQAKTLCQAYPNSKDFMKAIALFWDVYILDRRFSLSTGRPFAIQDTDIDPALPKPVSIIISQTPPQLYIIHASGVAVLILPVVYCVICR